ncbi:hypothetical protein EV183_001438 [Coemansia sp. RSA 2336]|nr:hypothetical protein EV183_001438 [Coemansia sp. RSA 2336]
MYPLLPRLNNTSNLVRKNKNKSASNETDTGTADFEASGSEASDSEAADSEAGAAGSTCFQSIGKLDKHQLQSTQTVTTDAKVAEFEPLLMPIKWRVSSFESETYINCVLMRRSSYCSLEMRVWRLLSLSTWFDAKTLCSEIRLGSFGLQNCSSQSTSPRQSVAIRPMADTKLSSYGKSEFLRHRNILLCPWSALAMLFFYKWHILCEPVPDFSNPRWAMQSLFHTKPALEDPCLEQLCGSAYTEFVDAANTGTQRYKYMTEPAYAVVNKGLYSSKLLRNAISSTQNMYVTRRSLQNGLCADVQLANAGFLVNNHEQPYSIPRQSFNVSLALEESIFPFADKLPSFDSMDTSEVGYDIRDTTVRFCNLLKVLRMVLLQDMAILFDIPFYRRMLQNILMADSGAETDGNKPTAPEDCAGVTQPSVESVPLDKPAEDDASILMTDSAAETNSNDTTAFKDPEEATDSLENDTAQDMLNGNLPNDESVTETPSAPKTDQSQADSALDLADGKATVHNQVDESAYSRDNGLAVSPGAIGEVVPNLESPEATIKSEEPALVAEPHAVKFIPILPRPRTVGLSSAKSESLKRNLESSEPAHLESGLPVVKKPCVKGTPASSQTPIIQKPEPIFIDLTIDNDDEDIGMDGALATNGDSNGNSSSSSDKNQSLAQTSHVTGLASPVTGNAKPTVPASGGDHGSAPSPTTAVDLPATGIPVSDERGVSSAMLPAADSNTNGQVDMWCRKSHEAEEGSSNLSTDSDQTLAMADSRGEQRGGTKDNQELADLTKLYKKAALADKLLAALHCLQSDVSSISESSQAMLRKISRIIARQKHPELPARRRHTEGPVDAPPASNARLLYSLDKLQIVTRRTNDHVSKVSRSISQSLEEAGRDMSDV